MNKRIAKKPGSTSDEVGVADICTPFTVNDIEVIVKKAVESAICTLHTEFNKKISGNA